MTKTVTDVESQTPESPKDGTNTVRYVLFALIALGAIAGVVILIYAFTASSPEKQASNAWEKIKDGKYTDVITIFAKGWDATVENGNTGIATVTDAAKTDAEGKEETPAITTVYIGKVAVTEDKKITITPTQQFRDGQLVTSSAPLGIERAYSFNEAMVSHLKPGTEVTFDKDEETKQLQGTIAEYPTGGDAYGTILVQVIKPEDGDSKEETTNYAVDSNLLNLVPVIQPEPRVPTGGETVQPTVPTNKVGAGNTGTSFVAPGPKPGKIPTATEPTKVDPKKQPKKDQPSADPKTILGSQAIEKVWGCILGTKDDCVAIGSAGEGISPKAKEAWKRLSANVKGIGCAIKDDVCRHKNKIAFAAALDFFGLLDQIPYFGQYLGGTIDQGLGYGRFMDTKWLGAGNAEGGTFTSDFMTDGMNYFPKKYTALKTPSISENAMNFAKGGFGTVNGIKNVGNAIKNVGYNLPVGLLQGTYDLGTDGLSKAGQVAGLVCKPDDSNCIQNKLLQDTANQRAAGFLNTGTAGFFGNVVPGKCDYETAGITKIPAGVEDCPA